MALLNPRFDAAGSLPGEAEHWTLITHVEVERIAGFGPLPCRAWEDFARWIAFQHVLGQSDLVLCFFDSYFEGYEDFTAAWDNSSYLFELPTGRVIVFPFGGGALDDMEDGWLTEPFARNLSDINTDAGVFDGNNFEDFEGHWKGNQTFVWQWDDVPFEAAMFDSETEPAERFTVAEWPPEEEE